MNVFKKSDKTKKANDDSKSSKNRKSLSDRIIGFLSPRSSGASSSKIDVLPGPSNANEKDKREKNTLKSPKSPKKVGPKV